MSIKLTDTQLVLLSAASQREDQYLTPPPGRRLLPAKKAAAKLLEGGLVREVRARKDAPVWRRDEDADQGFALKLTSAGLRAIAAEPGAEDEEVTLQTQKGDVIEHETSPGGIESSHTGPGAESGENTAPLRTPRFGTKIGIVIEMLERDTGAIINELVAATGWLPHTTRRTDWPSEARLRDRSTQGQGSERQRLCHRGAKQRRAGVTTAMGKTLRSGPVETARQPRPGLIADSLHDERSPAVGSFEAELAELERLSLEDLQLRWRNYWGRLAPAPSPWNLHSSPAAGTGASLQSNG
jgi:Protein of unknown function (DUF3489)